ncbi:MAG: hypothetical protein K0S09_150 [Sphingobacteriaceae bacterium]|jgi:hypothetical protein|nr:hypothetical protein [Sphingobacteriaceae bacterium]
MLNSNPFKISIPLGGTGHPDELTITPQGDNLFNISLKGKIIGKALKTLEDWEQVEVEQYPLPLEQFTKIAKLIDDHYLASELK